MRVKIFTLALALMLLSHCGFKLRQAQSFSESLPEINLKHQNIDPVFISRLEKNLKQSQITIKDDAAYTLNLNAYTENRRAASINSINATQVETQLSKTLKYSFVDTEGQLLIAPDQIKVQREYTNDNSNIAGKAEEERLIKKEIDKEIIQLLMRRLGNSAAQIEQTSSIEP